MQRLPFLPAAACLCALAVLCAARADTVTLDNGRTLEGHVIDNGDTITIEMAQGTVKIAKSRVKSITAKDTPEDEFRRRMDEVRAAIRTEKLTVAEAAARYFALAEWAGEQKLARARTEALKQALELDPEHVGARKASGFVWHAERWMTRAERNQALGMVFYQGKWVPPEAKEDAERAKEAARQDRAER
jgi:hypothetical protein